jgi:hypothetical protein
MNEESELDNVIVAQELVITSAETWSRSFSALIPERSPSPYVAVFQCRSLAMLRYSPMGVSTIPIMHVISV